MPMQRNSHLLLHEFWQIHLSLQVSKFVCSQHETLFADQVDQILEEDDRNDDGYVSYVEYVAARRTADVLHKADDDSDDNS